MAILITKKALAQLDARRAQLLYAGPHAENGSSPTLPFVGQSVGGNHEIREPAAIHFRLHETNLNGKMSIIALVWLLPVSMLAYAIVAGLKTNATNEIRYVSPTPAALSAYWKHEGPKNRAALFSDLVGSIELDISAGHIVYTEAEVIKDLGPPDSFMELGSTRSLFYLFNADSTQNKKDWCVDIEIDRNGCVEFVGTDDVPEILTPQIKRQARQYSPPTTR